MIKTVILSDIAELLRGKRAYVRNNTVLGFLSADRRHRRRLCWRFRVKNNPRGYSSHRIPPDVRIRLYHDSELSRQIYCNDFEWAERRFLSRFLREGDVFVDVGANIGLYTLTAAKHVGKSGHVYAFEPAPKTFERLRDNIQLNGFSNVSPFRLALSDRETHIELTIPLDAFDAWSSLAQPTAGSQFEVEEVRSRTWDDFARSNDLVGRVTMIKIDVEGWESRVLSGAYDTLSRSDAPVLQVEFSDDAAASSGSSCQALYRTLEELGYAMFVYDPTTGRLAPSPLRERYSSQNLLAMKKLDRVIARLGWVRLLA